MAQSKFTIDITSGCNGDVTWVIEGTKEDEIRLNQRSHLHTYHENYSVIMKYNW